MSFTCLGVYMFLDSLSSEGISERKPFEEGTSYGSIISKEDLALKRSLETWEVILMFLLCFFFDDLSKLSNEPMFAIVFLILIAIALGFGIH